jgi:hypothetical protein
MEICEKQIESMRKMICFLLKVMKKWNRNVNNFYNKEKVYFK